jgi:hypothetical protein
VHDFGNGVDDPAAITTRNAYGSLVLNARDLMFVDIDRDDTAVSQAPDLVSSVMSLFGRAAPAAQKTSWVLNDIQSVTEQNGLAARVYKTAAGYRAIVTNVPFAAGTSETETLLRQFGSDPLYVRLCHMQESFRARLSPKPWRCGFRLPPSTFPFITPQEEARFRAWESDYSTAAAQYATCRYISTFGGVRILPEFEDLIAYHDQETKSNSSLPLA